MFFNNHSHRAHGFSMLEVLISIFILAFGLLGLLSLQMSSLKNNHSAQMRTSATLLAYDILERVRLNKDSNYTLALDETPSGNTQKDADLIAWINALSLALPSGDGGVEVSANGIVTVTVQWDDSRSVEGSAEQQFVVSSVP